MLVDNVLRGLPSQDAEAGKAALQSLLRDGILVEHPTKHGKSVFIDAGLRLDLYERIREHKKFSWLPK